jgi:vacuolar-type H+-ATPase subunit E/Vma4
LLAALSSDLSASHRALNEVRRRLRERRPDLLERWRRRTREILVAEGEEDVEEDEDDHEGG